MDIPPVQVQMLGRFVIRRGSQEVSVSGRSQKLCLLLAALGLGLLIRRLRRDWWKA